MRLPRPWDSPGKNTGVGPCKTLLPQREQTGWGAGLGTLGELAKLHMMLIINGQHLYKHEPISSYMSEVSYFVVRRK